MLNFLFKQNSSIGLQEFLQEIKAGKRNFFDILRTPENSFEDASFDEIMSNTDDVLSEVNRVQKNFRDTYFDIFDACLIKYCDNGDIKWVFYTTSKDYQKISEIVETITSEFGTGYYDDKKCIPFTQTEKLLMLSKGVVTDVDQDLLSIWLADGITTLLQYRVSPLRQLSLMVTIKAVKIEDKEVRRRTILEVIEKDISAALLQDPIEIKKGRENNAVKFSDITYAAPQKIMGVFNQLRFRTFGDVESYIPGRDTNLTLISSVPISTDKKTMVAEKLIHLYGPDSSGTNDLAIHEHDMIDAGEFWTGRNWHFNEAHALWDMQNQKEKMSYWLSIDDFEDADGFKIFIIGYNNLLELFGPA